MYQTALIFLMAMLAGYALVSLTPISFITGGLTTFLAVIGTIAMIIFALALIYIGVKTLFDKTWR